MAGPPARKEKNSKENPRLSTNMEHAEAQCITTATKVEASLINSINQLK
jgi:hypothetical protein